MAYPTYLKLILPGIDIQTTPTLTKEQVDLIPSKLLDALYEYGKNQNLGDFTLVTIDCPPHQVMAQWLVQWLTYGASASFLEHRNIEVVRRAGSEEPIAYVPDIHAQDLAFTPTPKTHGDFCNRIDQYIFSVQYDLRDLQAHLSEELRSRFPVYEAEVMALLTETSSNGINDLHNVDAALSEFISQRLFLVRDNIVDDGSLLGPLQTCISSEEYGAALLRHATPAQIQQAVQHLSETVHPRTQIVAFFDIIYKKYNGFVTSGPNGRAASAIVDRPNVANNNNAMHAFRGSSATSQANMVPSVAGAFDRPNVAANNNNYAMHVVSGSNAASQANMAPPVTGTIDRPNVAANNSTYAMQTFQGISAAIQGKMAPPAIGTGAKQRRPQPSTDDFDYSHGTHALNIMTYARPQANNEWWSVLQDRWAKLSDTRKKIFTHIGLICETDLGTVAQTSCTNCVSKGIPCEVYINDPITAYAGKNCAKCRMDQKSCSTAQA